MRFLSLTLFTTAVAAASISCPSKEGVTSAANTTATYCPGKPANTRQQEAILSELINTLYVERNAAAALNKHMSEDYIQHNPSILSGRQNSIDGLSGFLPLVNFTVLRTGVSNDLAWVHTKGDLQGQVMAIVDIFRFDGTCIREHWDVTQAATANATNPLALF